MLKIAICDDNPEHLHYTASLIQKELSSFRLELETFSAASQLIKLVEEDNYTPDIAVLDIDLGPENGIDLAKRMNSLVPTCRIIFLTGFADYAPASYEARHVWFVLKSGADQFLGAALRRALDGMDDPSAVLGITVRTGGKSFFIPLGEILYLERYARKARIVCKNAVHLIPGSPSALINAHAAPFFVRCHQGYWVNIRQVTGLERDEFILVNGTRIPISRSFRDAARSRFFEQLQS